VNEQFILDLSLPPPPPPPGITSDTNGKNLTLHTTKGPVKAEIWIRHKGSPKSKRVSLDLCSSEGPMRAIVVRLSLSILASALILKGETGREYVFI
jgi:hypothetical protein